MRRWKWRLIAFLTGLLLGLALFLLVSFLNSLFRSHSRNATRAEQFTKHDCDPSDSFQSPEEILAALKNEDVAIRREVFRKLFLRPGVTTIYYDYERDRDYPERAERAELRYVNLDDESGNEAVITFVRYENPVALVLKKDRCGWHLVGALSAWLRFEKYPYQDWIEMPETVKPGVHEILVRESSGDSVRYSRNARLLKLIDGSLVEVAEFTEESIRPLEDYREVDWNDVKRLKTTHSTFIPESEGSSARIGLETKEEIIKYSGSPPACTFWLETDGAWHAARQHWRERAMKRIQSVYTLTRELVWDNARKRFIEER